MPNAQDLALALAAVNLLTLFLFWHDKRCARNGRWRVPESMLLGLSLAGGSPAACLAMKRLRHKTQKTGFRVRFRLVVAVQCLAAAYLLTHGVSA
jgi:uncharacterized membrane protein YsdA (DUF1294 family)